jgi:endoglucanase
MVAHMDHPAFEVTAADGPAATGQLLGGVRVEALPAGVPLRLNHRGTWAPATLMNAERNTESGAVTLQIDAPKGAAAGDWGVWEMLDYAEDGDLIRMRACDDLAGCASILAALAHAAAGDWPVDLTAVFTRAEEVGLVGATLVAQQGLLPSDTLVISVESSRQLPGARQGLGPVIRVGDVRRTFHPEAEAVLQAASDALLKADATWKAQRQLMSGGTCEATAFSLFGYRTTGIALPLGNYHNVPDAVYDGEAPAAPVAPEFIHRGDLAGAARLLAEATRIAASPPSDALRQRAERMAEDYRERLRSSAG